MRTLKQTLILWVVATVCVATLVAGVSFYFVARAYLIEQFDEELEDRFDLMASAIEIEDGEIDTGFDDIEMDDFGEKEDDDDDEEDEEDEEDEDGDDDANDALSFLMLREADAVIYRSPTLGDSAQLPTGQTEDPVWVGLPSGRRGRVYTETFLPPLDLDDDLFEWAADAYASSDYGPHRTVTMSLARETVAIDAALSMLGLGLAAAGALLAILMSIVVGYGVRRGLRPVDELTTRLAALESDALNKPIPSGPLPQELQPIVEQYNAVLARVAQAYERERGFSADVAHELRTPLAGLLTTLEVASAQPRSPEQSAEAFAELLEVAEHMRTLVEALLKLAALEAGTSEDATGTVQLDQEIERVWRLVIHNGASRRVFNMTRDLSADAPIQTRPGLLELVLRNVMHNAAAYVDTEGTVTLASALEQASARITITNTGSTVSTQDAARVFDRFWRADSSRAGTGKHCGLGLALTRSAVRALGGTISASSETGGAFVVTITLPRD
ncbi:ATP-binding protein [Phycisphaeraceae bacterium D3-23]